MKEVQKSAIWSLMGNRIQSVVGGGSKSGERSTASRNSDVPPLVAPILSWSTLGSRRKYWE